MSQATTWGVPQVGPVSPSVYAGRDQDAFDALLSCHRGAARPSYAVAGTIWAKTIDATEEQLYLFDGTSDIYIGKLDLTNHLFLPVAGGVVVTASGTELNLLDGKLAVAGVIGQSEALSGAASVFFTGLVAGKRYRLELEILGVSGVLNSVFLRFGNTGGFDAGANYNWAQLYLASSSTATGANGIKLNNGQFNGTSYLYTIEFSAVPGDATKMKVAGQGVGGTYANIHVGADYDGASDVDRVQVVLDSGTMDGRARLIQTN